MRCLLNPLLLALLCLLPAVPAPAEEPATEDLPLVFNGKDLTGWRVPSPNPFWQVKDGVLIGTNDEKKTGSMLYTEAIYQDVIVECEVRFHGEVDSGLMLRKPEIQVQIGISRSLKRDMTCSFYVGKYPDEGQAKDAGRLLKPVAWNRIRFQAKGNTFTVWLNGTKVSEYTDPKYAQPAPLGLQIHPKVEMQVEFRDIRALPLGRAAAPPPKQVN